MNMCRFVPLGDYCLMYICEAVTEDREHECLYYSVGRKLDSLSCASHEGDGVYSGCTRIAAQEEAMLTKKLEDL